MGIHDEKVISVELGDQPGDNKDDTLLKELGYTPELKRNFSVIQVFGIAFSIMSLLPSIASVLVYSLPAGPVGMTWGWLIASCLILTVGMSMAEMGSAMPTSGGLYWWTYKFSPPSVRKPLCFLAGYASSLGLTGALVSIDYGFSVLLLSVPAIATDGGYSPTKYHTYGVFAATVISHGIAGALASKLVAKMQTFCIITNAVVIVVTMIALPIGKARNAGGINSGKYVFSHMENFYTWPQGFSFILSWLSPVWTICAFDSCVHMAEEASNASVAVPFGIVGSISLCGILGFFINAVIAASMDTNIENLLGASSGQPMAQILYDALGKRWTIGIMTCLFVIQWFMGFSVAVAGSRQVWAFSRDGALPFSRWLRVLNVKLQSPLRAMWFICTLALIIALLSLIDTAATSALFSLAVASNYLAWIIPIFMRVVFNVDTFKPGPFYLGRIGSKVVGSIATIFGTFVIVCLTMFPLSGPDPTKDTMNYTAVINGTVWLGSLAYYYIDARKWFTGPKQTLEELNQFIESDVIAENDLSIESSLKKD
ncbi:uncharacterized protein SAPINGB_P006396 [Magnusiomyces paraingens]|uniref:Amino acid permease/ SLC12A domain-containing protein n=1 Tax=Magnusiomyces paraingens TaxID=2606893 RepID=A0A5E8C5Y1_9ASCO|nr:uncharacterized protein SAPINGB_P006396 [Saprochaete ingens]VVT58812.1 unnamed protein product [Saprochaete ingens]